MYLAINACKITMDNTTPPQSPLREDSKNFKKAPPGVRRDPSLFKRPIKAETPDQPIRVNRIPLAPIRPNFIAVPKVQATREDEQD